MPERPGCGKGDDPLAVLAKMLIITDRDFGQSSAYYRTEEVDMRKRVILTALLMVGIFLFGFHFGRAAVKGKTENTYIAVDSNRGNWCFLIMPALCSARS